MYLHRQILARVAEVIFEGKLSFHGLVRQDRQALLCSARESIMGTGLAGTGELAGSLSDEGFTLARQGGGAGCSGAWRRGRAPGRARERLPPSPRSQLASFCHIEQQQKKGVTKSLIFKSSVLLDFLLS